MDKESIVEQEAITLGTGDASEELEDLSEAQTVHIACDMVCLTAIIWNTSLPFYHLNVTLFQAHKVHKPWILTIHGEKGPPGSAVHDVLISSCISGDTLGFVQAKPDLSTRES